MILICHHYWEKLNSISLFLNLEHTYLGKKQQAEIEREGTDIDEKQQFLCPKTAHNASTQVNG